MKRLISITLSLAMVLSLSACGGGNGSASSAGSASSSADGGISVDKNLLTVDITLPASFFEGEDMSDFDADAYAAEQGFNKAVLNDDGSVSINMSKAKHNKLMDEMSKSAEDTFDSMVGAEDSPYIQKITHSESFDTIQIIVDKAGYESGGLASAFIPLTVYVPAAFYQMFAGVEAHCEIKIVDSATGDTIESVTYPDALNGAE